MTLRFVPLPSSEETRRVQETQLDGTTYVLSFTWSSREDRWYLNLADRDGNALRNGIKLVPKLSLLRILTSDNAPPGKLFVVTPNDEDPTRLTIGDARLVYAPAEDV